MPLPIYLDYAATTPVDPSVAEAMAACLTQEGIFANPASRSHIYGWQAEQRVEMARRYVAELINCDPEKLLGPAALPNPITCTKGIFENDNYQGHLITSVIEHKAVIDPTKWLEQKGVSITWLEPDTEGLISAKQIQQALRKSTKLVALCRL